MGNISFETRQDFVQAAFNQVAEIIYEHGLPILECGSPAEGTEDCLDHLLTVLNDWSYNSEKVVIYLDFFTESNRVIREELDEFL
jgi:hypothetical protein